MLDALFIPYMYGDLSNYLLVRKFTFWTRNFDFLRKGIAFLTRKRKKKKEKKYTGYVSQNKIKGKK